MLLYGTLALCALVLAVIVYRYDLYDREPLLLLALAATLGMAGMHVAGMAQVYFLLRAGDDGINSHWLISALAASHEELAKALVVLVIGLAFKRIFDDPMDGLIYGSFAGIGAAVEESIAAVSQLHPGEGLPPAEVLRITGHLVMGGIGGFGLGFLWRGWWWPAAAAVSLAAAMALHFGWDMVAVPANDTGEMSVTQRLFALGVMLTGLGCYAALVHLGSAMSRARYAGGRPVTWAWPFSRRQAARSPRRRSRKAPAGRK